MMRARMGLALLLLAILFVRLVAPTGFMPMADAAGHVTISLCPGGGAMAMPMPGSRDHPAAIDDQHCPFGALGLATTGGADVPLLAAALVFALVLAVRETAQPTVPTPPRLRPPLRAPPRG